MCQLITFWLMTSRSHLFVGKIVRAIYLTHPYFLDTGKTLRHILFSTIRDRLHYFWIASQKGEPCMYRRRAFPVIYFPVFAWRSFFSTVRGLSFPFNSRATRKKAKSGQAFLVFNIMYFLTAAWELITQSPQAGNTPPYLAGRWKFSQRHPGSAEQLFFSSKKKK